MPFLPPPLSLRCLAASVHPLSGILELVRPDSMVSARSCRRRHGLPGPDGDGWRHLECASARQPRGRHPQRLRHDGARFLGPHRLEHIPVGPQAFIITILPSVTDAHAPGRHAASRTSSSRRASTRPACWPPPSLVSLLATSRDPSPARTTMRRSLFSSSCSPSTSGFGRSGPARPFGEHLPHSFMATWSPPGAATSSSPTVRRATSETLGVSRAC